jgi:hypothetical protein
VDGGGGDRRVGRVQAPGAHAGGDQRADAALVAIALGDNACAKAGREGVDFEMGRRSLDLVKQAQDVGDGDLAQPQPQRPSSRARGGQRREQPIRGAVLAEEEELVLAAEIVLQVAERKVGGRGDVAHAGGGEAAGAKDPRPGADDRHPAGIGTD